MLSNKIRSLVKSVSRISGLSRLYDLMVHVEFDKRRGSHQNPLNRKSSLVGWSQFDEDSITLEILERLSLTAGSFLEFGVGNGLENNTLVLLAKGWKGHWFGGEELALDVSSSKRLRFHQVWITRGNIVDLSSSADKSPDVVSLDLDGNDLFLVRELLQSKIMPKLFIVEYNAKVPWGVDFSIDYNDNHVFKSNDYFGASLSSFVGLFEEFGFRLVCCSLSGANAFFVREDCTEAFSDVPDKPAELYSAPFYFQTSRKMHPTSVDTVKVLIS